MKFLQDLENKILNADLNEKRKKLNMPPMTKEEEEITNKEREEKNKKDKEERKRREKELSDKVNAFADKCGSFGWKVIKTQLSMIFLAAFFFVIWLLFYPV